MQECLYETYGKTILWSEARSNGELAVLQSISFCKTLYVIKVPNEYLFPQQTERIVEHEHLDFVLLFV